MINKVDSLTVKLNNLYKIYEEKCWNNTNDKINIIFQDNTISFYFDGEIVDQFCISFDKCETKVYRYLALNIFYLVLGDVYIYKDDNCFYNQKHKPYLSVIFCDDNLLTLVNDIVFCQDEVFIKENIDSMYKRKPFKIYSNKFLKQIDERIDITKKRFRSYDK